jgi:uncharacterized protein (DUF2252 family)
MKANEANGEVKPVETPDQRETRRRAGKALRESCPRSSHADPGVGRDGRDPLALIEGSNKDRLENLLPIRFTRMAESAFAFYRGSAVVQADDLTHTPSSGITVQCCGDCHLMNFGGFATPERTLVFDINDFDETLPGPFEWDVKRLAASFVLAARWLGFGKGDARKALQALLASYRTSLVQFAQMSVLDIWYNHVAFDEVLREYANEPAILKRWRRTMEKATTSTSDHVFHKITRMDDNRTRIVDEPPLLYHAAHGEHAIDETIIPFLKKYRLSLAPERQVLFDRYTLVDVAYKVVGVGSVGTRCYIVLLAGTQDDHLFLQVKEARPSVLEGRAGPSPYDNNGARVVIGQRLMQTASDIFLGWSRGPQNRDFYVRQMRDMKIAPDLTDYTPRLLAEYGKLCGRVLARAHAKGGDAATIAGYVGKGTSFDDAIAEYAVAYADQVEQDYESFKAATRSGRFPIETLPSEIETAIR